MNNKQIFNSANGQKKTRKGFLTVLGFLFFLIIVLVFYVGFSMEETDVLSDSPVTSDFSKIDLSVLIKIKSARYLNSISSLTLDWDYLKSGDFSALVVNGDIPIQARSDGRANPFIAY